MSGFGFHGEKPGTRRGLTASNALYLPPTAQTQQMMPQQTTQGRPAQRAPSQPPGSHQQQQHAGNHQQQQHAGNHQQHPGQQQTRQGVPLRNFLTGSTMQQPAGAGRQQMTDASQQRARAARTTVKSMPPSATSAILASRTLPPSAQNPPKPAPKRAPALGQPPILSAITARGVAGIASRPSPASPSTSADASTVQALEHRVQQMQMELDRERKECQLLSVELRALNESVVSLQKSVESLAQGEGSLTQQNMMHELRATESGLRGVIDRANRDFQSQLSALNAAVVAARDGSATSPDAEPLREELQRVLRIVYDNLHWMYGEVIWNGPIPMTTEVGGDAVVGTLRPGDVALFCHPMERNESGVWMSCKRVEPNGEVVVGWVPIFADPSILNNGKPSEPAPLVGNFSIFPPGRTGGASAVALPGGDAMYEGWSFVATETDAKAGSGSTSIRPEDGEIEVDDVMEEDDASHAEDGEDANGDE